MLQRNQKPPGNKAAKSVRIAIVAAEYNRRHVDGLLDGARRALDAAGVEVEVVRVPGAFEIPLLVELLATSSRPSPFNAIIALGVIIRGETAHADLVGSAVTRALMETSVRRRIPVIHEVLLVGNQRQAEVRCHDPKFNRGGEAAATALAMARLTGRFASAPARR